VALRPVENHDETKEVTMEKKPKLTRAELIDSIPLRGKVLEVKPGDFITLQTPGALVTVHFKDIHQVRDISENEKEILVPLTARITHETTVTPTEARAILSGESLVAATVGRFAGGECECSRCSGGECECSRCTECTECSRCSDLRTGLGRFAGGECECSRCIDGPCECSRCVDTGFGGLTKLGGFRRRIR
jgi:hypothetical protein